MSEERLTAIESLREWITDVTFEGTIMVKDKFVIEKINEFCDELESQQSEKEKELYQALSEEVSKAWLIGFEDGKDFKTHGTTLYLSGLDYFDRNVKSKYQNLEKYKPNN